MNSKTDNGRIDLWVRQVTLMAVLLVALALIVIGLALYAPHAHARPAERFPDPANGLKGLDLERRKDPWKREYVREGADADISSRDADQSGEETK